MQPGPVAASDAAGVNDDVIAEMKLVREKTHSTLASDIYNSFKS